jgi:NAD(P)-dependent dehydrogenase (short-subunit alcohol dehydrogenase family)
MGMTTPARDLLAMTDRVALVTGGSGNQFGAQIVEALAEAGAQVVITSRDPAHAQRRAADYRAHGLRVEGVELDLSSESAIRDCTARVAREVGPVDVLVNNAATICMDNVESVSLDDWNAVLRINTTAPMLLSRAVAPTMLHRRKGVIVNIASIYGVVSPDQGIYGSSGLNSPLVYGVSKAALIQMTRYLSTYWAPAIRVNCISPGGLFNNQAPEFMANYVRRTPLQRMAGSDDLKGIVLYLASDASAFVTGQNFLVDGGWTAW